MVSYTTTTSTLVLEGGNGTLLQASARGWAWLKGGRTLRTKIEASVGRGAGSPIGFEDGGGVKQMLPASYLLNQIWYKPFALVQNPRRRN